MTLKWKIGIAIPVALLTVGVSCWYTIAGFRERIGDWAYFVTRETELTIHPPPPRCKLREAEFNTRRERIEKHAKESLRIGTKKEDVIRFFASENIPVTFSELDGQNEAEGTIDVKGDAECGSLACGDDAAFVGVRVAVDQNGTVLSDAVVVGIYADCL